MASSSIKTKIILKTMLTFLTATPDFFHYFLNTGRYLSHQFFLYENDTCNGAVIKIKY